MTKAAFSVSWRISGTLPNGDRIRENYPHKTDAINRKGEATATVVETRIRAASLSEEQLADAEAAAEAAGNRSLSGVVHT